MSSAGLSHQIIRGFKIKSVQVSINITCLKIIEIIEKSLLTKSKLYIIQRIGIAIQRTNVTSVMGNFDASAKLHEIFLYLIECVKNM